SAFPPGGSPRHIQSVATRSDPRALRCTKAPEITATPRGPPMFSSPGIGRSAGELYGQWTWRQGGRHHMLMSERERPLAQVKRELEGETAIVTGSTSGIGLGIARALAQRGANVVLNGFGAPCEVEIVRAALAMEHDVEVTYDGADMG